ALPRRAKLSVLGDGNLFTGEHRQDRVADDRTRQIGDRTHAAHAFAGEKTGKRHGTLELAALGRLPFRRGKLKHKNRPFASGWQLSQTLLELTAQRQVDVVLQ